MRIINTPIKSITSSQIRVNLGVFRPTESVFQDYFSVARHTDAQEMILSQIIVCCSVLTEPGDFSTFWARSWGLFRCNSTRPGDDFVLNHSLLREFECNWELFWHSEHVFEDCFGVPQHVDAQETILSQITVCSSVWTVAGGFSTRWVLLWGLFQCASTCWCPRDNFVLNHSLLLSLDCS